MDLQSVIEGKTAPVRGGFVERRRAPRLRDPLPSWADGPVKAAVIDFMVRVTRRASTDYVPPAARRIRQRWHALVRAAGAGRHFYLLDRLCEIANRNPDMGDREPFKALLAGDADRFVEVIEALPLDFGVAKSIGLGSGALREVVGRWLATPKHAQRGRTLTDNLYLPQLELLGFLRANYFRTYIVSGGGLDLLKDFPRELYWLPHDERAIRQSGPHYELTSGRARIVTADEIGWGSRKARGSNVIYVGRRPIFTFGNSDRDLALMHCAEPGRARTSRCCCVMTTPSANSLTTATSRRARSPRPWISPTLTTSPSSA